MIPLYPAIRALSPLFLGVRFVVATLTAVFLSAQLMLPNKALSQSLGASSQIDVRHSLDIRYALGFDKGETQLAEISYKPELSGRLNDGIDYFVSSRLRAFSSQALEQGTMSNQSDSRSHINRRSFIGDNIELELKEAYADIFTDNGYLRIGKQTVVWGQADGLRVLDQINPLNYREFILGDIEDRRIALWMAKLEHSFADITAEFIWLPDHSYNDSPNSAPFKPTSPRLVPRLSESFRGTVIRQPSDRPNRFIRDDDYALRLSGFSQGWDWSLNAFYFYDDSAAIDVDSELGSEVILSPSYKRSLLFGGSASNAFDKLTFRSELAYQTNKHQLVNNKPGLNTLNKTEKFDQISSVLGLDYQLSANTLISGQLFVSALLDSGDIEQTYNSATLLARQELLNDTIILEGLIIHDLDKSDGSLQLSAKYYLDDAITLKAGMDVFYGDREGLYGQFREASRMTVGLEYNF